MRSQLLRHLGRLSPAWRSGNATRHASLDALAGQPHEPATHADEYTPHDEAALLLHVDAEIEHGLMVQYLYAAWSLGEAPADLAADVARWQDTILGIAKEEMGHLVSVQNALRVLGSPLNLSRDDFPWDAPFYPFPFQLEPLTLESLAKYVYAESPENWTGADADEIREIVDASVAHPHTVSALFRRLIPLIESPHLIPDSAFLPQTYPFQANWDEWGRGYHGASRGTARGVTPAHAPDVLVVPFATRDDVVAGLKSIAAQGEATSLASDSPSHFTRFLAIYKEMKALAEAGRLTLPLRPVATNPTVSPGGVPVDEDPAQGLPGPNDSREIIHPPARLWAKLFNLRYRMLLGFLAHSFDLDGALHADGGRTARGTVVNAAFGEMYNLRAIAEILMRSPLGDTPADGRAGPPFQMPYTLDPGSDEANRWRVHRDQIQAARKLARALLASDADQAPYLHALLQSDDGLDHLAQRYIAAHTSPATF